jgi:hypothetical protein
LSISIDATAPTISGAVTTAPTGGTAYRGPVIVHWTCSDATSGVQSCPADQMVSTLGTSTVSQTASDVAGNVSQAAQVTVTIDDGSSTEIDPQITPPLNGSGWSNVPVTVHFVCGALSGVASCTADTPVSSEGANQQVPGTVVDNAGNSVSTNATVSLDFTPPTVKVTGVQEGGSYVLGAVPAEGCSTTDALSGVATQASLSVSGGAPDGTGSLTATCTGGTDNAGNTASATVHYTVVPSSGTLSGTVSLTTNGSPVGGAAVRLYASPNVAAPVLATTTADSSGHFAFEAVPAGTYWVYAGLTNVTYSAFSATSTLVSSGSNSTLNVSVAPGAAGSATVFGPTGSPVQGATVRVMKSNNPTANRVETDSAGHYSITGLVAGTYTLQVTAYGYQVFNTGSFTVAGSGTVAMPDITLAAAPVTAGIGGVVTGPGGAPLAGVFVRLWLVNCLCGTNSVLQTTTNASGAWSFAGVPAGVYNVQFGKTGYSGSVYYASSLTFANLVSPATLGVTLNANATLSNTSYNPGT